MSLLCFLLAPTPPLAAQAALCFLPYSPASENQSGSSLLPWWGCDGVASCQSGEGGTVPVVVCLGC